MGDRPDLEREVRIPVAKGLADTRQRGPGYQEYTFLHHEEGNVCVLAVTIVFNRRLEVPARRSDPERIRDLYLKIVRVVSPSQEDHRLNEPGRTFRCIARVDDGQRKLEVIKRPPMRVKKQGEHR